MELQERLQYFAQEVNQDIQVDIDEELKNYQASLDKDFANYQAQLDQRYQKQALDERVQLEKDNNKVIAQDQIRLQRDLYLRNNELKAEIFDQLKAALADYKQSPAYFDQLVAMVKSVQNFAENEDFIIYLDKSDSGLLDQLEAASGHPIRPSDREFFGGLRGVLTDRQILLDYSFASFIQLQEENFTIEEVAQAYDH
ncbi:hypothetical protein AWM75_02205 [Aerococcus urinaehominis]|uniref:Uncharacterized protein n=1 Tax=Aerococcus urinaehominis TaxID=128944 RepID=A0A109RHN6_9LACT|nr:OmpH family outer membrane protein [Aerococcus urinaehominis]AMB98875.1 hypothetical protein AWM75_02205 [Aerococcus urinaehominis]SDM16346.1 hypothetical protein SAMN04487985_10725 [Aerococcus urinaehominis]